MALGGPLALPALLVAGSAVLAAEGTVIPVPERGWKQCSQKPGEGCIKTQCCNIPGYKCYQKDKHWAACIKENACKKGWHYDPPDYKKAWWTCDELTGGCSPLYGQCNLPSKSYDGPPCCEWGCVCKNVSKTYSQCTGTSVSNNSTNKCNAKSVDTLEEKAEAQDHLQVAEKPPTSPWALAFGGSALLGVSVVAGVLVKRARSRGLLRALGRPFSAEDCDEQARSPHLEEAE
eukprot:CAMPEP_0171105888 /NCGR_PEP_ID=MMETSP0766_2-20121228/63640_1 /TAXON_ID=439317 /ORGANISM="Gambierdiscus australes, Strain CAWD 149" /LENGTH=231 /DNA_ID=CAMNT_0011566847 /DNA_START=96 /DNA_END=791 /DNA_ORIENTATION=+